MASAGTDGEALTLYVTFPNLPSAEKAGRMLVERKLAACANLIPGMRSVYRRQGAVEEANEVVMIAKTVRSRLADAVAAIEAIHPYDTPAITAWPIVGGSRRYLDWIGAETE